MCSASGGRCERAVVGRRQCLSAHVHAGRRLRPYIALRSTTKVRFEDVQEALLTVQRTTRRYVEERVCAGVGRGHHGLSLSTSLALRQTCCQK